LVVILAAAAALVYVARSGDGAAKDSAVYRHYFAIGKHVCQAPEPATIGGITVWSGATTAAIRIPRSVPAEQRRGLLAGCNAALG
jgi:hypothetical protein